MGILQVGGEGEALMALQNKGVDAATISEPFTTIAEREGFSVVADLSRLNVPYTLHGIGTRKQLAAAQRALRGAHVVPARRRVDAVPAGNESAGAAGVGRFCRTCRYPQNGASWRHVP